MSDRINLDNRGQTFVETTSKFFMTKVSSAAKIFIYTVVYGEYFNIIKPGSESASRIKKTGNIVKLTAGGFFELPEKLKVVGNATKEWADSPSKPGAKKVFWAVNDTVNPAVDSVELLDTTGIAKISEGRFTFLKKINGVAMILGFGKMAYESHQKLERAEGLRGRCDTPNKLKNLEVEIRKQWFDRAKAISYFVLGVLIVSSLFLGIVAPSIAFTTAAASALVFTILGFYNEEWGHTAAAKRNWLAGIA